MYGGVDPLGPHHWPVAPLPDLGGFEIGHEAATLVMRAAVRQLVSWRTAELERAHAVLLGLRLDPGRCPPAGLSVDGGPQR